MNLEKKNMISDILRNSKFSIDDYNFVLSHLSDEESKDNLFYRTMLDGTNDVYYCLKLIEMMYYNKSLDNINDFSSFNLVKFLLKNDNYRKKIYLFGYDSNLVEKIIPNLFNRWKDGIGLDIQCIYEVSEFFENQVDCCYNLALFNENDFFDPSCLFLICTPNFYGCEKLFLNYGVSKENIFKLNYNSMTGFGSFRESKGVQYFGESFFKPNKNEVFVDCGACNLDSVCDFVSWCEGDYKKVYALEPSDTLYDTCIDVLDYCNLSNVEVLKYGVWSEDTSMIFNDTGDSDATFFSINKSMYTPVEVRKLDTILKDEDVTLIKMDVEGSEAEAIIGATDTIKRCKPRLMICGYHFPFDCIKLIKQILELNPNYKIYIRHYNFNIFETVIYFV